MKIKRFWNCKVVVALMLYVAGLAACNNNSKRLMPAPPPPSNKEALIRINKYLVKQDHEEIAKFLKKNNVEMDVSESGLWYKILEAGTGDSIKTGDQVEFKYNSYLLDSTLCYSSDQDGVKSVRLGRSELEVGLDEGIRLLKKGGKAEFILPPHLAFGLVGDRKKIPARAILRYTIEITDVKHQQQ